MSEHSPYAAKAAIAAFEKGKFVEVYEGIMTLPEMNEETINQILRDEELDVDEIKKLSEEKKSAAAFRILTLCRRFWELTAFRCC